MAEPKKKRKNKRSLVSYLICPFCGHSLYMGYFEKSDPFKTPLEPLEFEVLQVREQRPRQPRKTMTKGGFFLVPERCETILQLRKSNPALAHRIIERVKALAEGYESAGLFEGD